MTTKQRQLIDFMSSLIGVDYEPGMTVKEAGTWIQEHKEEYDRIKEIVYENQFYVD
ncbi:hypothetical protein GIX45_03320 [Erwinia sp. CPCC 100877]|nr:hypothetical protein [Erwinia sp. CPCC 100877]